MTNIIWAWGQIKFEAKLWFPLLRCATLHHPFASGLVLRSNVSLKTSFNMIMKFVVFDDIVIGMAISIADFFRAISVAEDIKMGFAIAIAMAAVCQAMSHWRLHPEEWRHPDEHDKLCLFDDMGIGMAIQRIKMSFFLLSNLFWWRHQDDHRLFDDVYFCVNELCLFFKSMWHVYIHWNNNTCFWREMCRWIFQDGHDELCLFQSHGPWPGILYKILKGKNHLRARTDESCLYLFKYFCWLYNFL